MITTHATTHLAVLAHTWATALPNPAPAPPPGAEKILRIVQYVKWGAGAALVAGFLIGLMVYAGGRFVDHHRAGRVGTTMMLAAVFGGLLYSVGYQLINSFAGG